MDTTFFQHYWWFIISLLGGILVFLLFVQGGQSLLFSLGKKHEHRTMMTFVLARKWELTFTTLVTFGGALFASFPLFYSTSFGGAYWLWMLILFSFVIQAVSYEFMNRKGNLLGKTVYEGFLFVNGLLGTVLLGVAVSMFFTGASFSINKANISGAFNPVISSWDNPLHGLEAIADAWNLVLGFAVFFLARSLGCLYFMNGIANDEFRKNVAKALLINAPAFVILFVAYLVKLLLSSGYAVDADGVFSAEEYKYLNNLLAMPWLPALLLSGVLLVLYGIGRTLLQTTFTRGIRYAGIGTVLTVLALLLVAGYNDTAYYPSLTDMKSSLSLSNSSSSYFTLKVMSIVSLLIPFVLAYVRYAWKALDGGRKIASAKDTEDYH
ncbi:MAG: cytochrome d ubiquinol oxidase subunit II [Dysgonamonadaceae bacterium]|nr:cytochrome d ubiquinol oxidase subunit II [Dysgonamonadaceae bacterium]